MSDFEPEYFEKTFKTNLLYDPFIKLAARTCRSPHWITVEGRDRSEIPFSLFLSVVFSTIDDRDRFVIALRFAEDERAAARSAVGGAKTASRPVVAKEKQYANA